MYARISIIETTNGEVRHSSVVQGGEDAARRLYGLLNGLAFSNDTENEVTEVTVVAEKRIPSSPTYEPIDLGS